MKALLKMVKTEFTLSIREFSGILFGILMPIGVMLLLGTIYGNKTVENTNYTWIQQSFAAVIAISICATGLMGLPISVSTYREKKILKKYKVTPISPSFILSAQFINNFIFSIISLSMVYIVAKLFYGYTMIGSFTIFLLTYLLVTFAIYAIGIFIASVSKTTKTSNLLCTLFYFPMLFVSGATVPYEILPEGLQKFSDIMPLTQGIKLLKGITLGSNIGDYSFQIGLLIITALSGIIISIKTFRWE